MNNRGPGDVLHVVLLFVLLFCVVVLVVVAGVQSSLLSRCIVVLFSSCCSCCCYCRRWCLFVVFFFVVRSSFVVSSSACHCPSLLVAITVYCCFALFRVAVLVLVHVVVVFIASDFLSRFLKRDGVLGHMGLVPHPAQGLMRDTYVLTSWIPPSPHWHVAGRPIPTRVRPPSFQDRWHMAGRPILTYIRPPPFRDQQSPRSLL